MRRPRPSTVLASLATAWSAALAPVVGSARVLVATHPDPTTVGPPPKESLAAVQGLRAVVLLGAVPAICAVVTVLLATSRPGSLRRHAAVAVTGAVALLGYLGFAAYLIVAALAPGIWLLALACLAATAAVDGGAPRRGHLGLPPALPPPSRQRRRVELQVSAAYVAAVAVLVTAWGSGWWSTDHRTERALFGATMPTFVLVLPMAYVTIGLCRNLADQGYAWLANGIVIGLFAAVAAFQAWVAVQALRRAHHLGSPRQRTQVGGAGGPTGTIVSHEPAAQHLLRRRRPEHRLRA